MCFIIVEGKCFESPQNYVFRHSFCLIFPSAYLDGFTVSLKCLMWMLKLICNPKIKTKNTSKSANRISIAYLPKTNTNCFIRSHIFTPQISIVRLLGTYFDSSCTLVRSDYRSNIKCVAVCI